MKKTRIAIIILFLLFFSGLLAGSVLAKDREFSANENRYLAGMPEFSWTDVREGRFQEKLEKYLNDQIVGRDWWISLKTAVQQGAGDKEIGGAYLGADGYDFEKIAPEDVDSAQLERNIASVRDYFAAAEEHIAPGRLSFLLVPTAGLILEEKLPKNARLFDQNACIDAVAEAFGGYNFLDVRAELAAHSGEYIYYRTDHHWTTDGAYLAYEKWCASLGESCAGREELERTVVTESFRGSLYSKILNADSAYDSIWIYGPAGEGVSSGKRYTVTMDGGKPGALYDESRLEEKDKYAFFFGGNAGQIHISGGSSGENEERNLLVVKDSFANAFVPLAAGRYENIYMVDLRYYNGDMREYLTGHGITDVLVLYNISNFISDPNLYKLGGD